MSTELECYICFRLVPFIEKKKKNLDANRDINTSNNTSTLE